MSISEFLTKRRPMRAQAAPRSPVAADFAADADQVDLAAVFRILAARWATIALVVALFVGAAVAYGVLTPKTWRTSARVLLDPRDKQIVGTDVGRQTQGMELGWVETRLELVKSYDTLATVVRQEHLVDDPDVLSPAGRAAADPEGAAVRNLAEMILVERPKENALIDVTVTTRSPEKSARLANAVARAFVEGLAGAKVDQVEHANDLLARQVDEMRSKMLAAEARVEDYKRDHGIAMTRGNLVEEETLRQSNENLVAARAKMQEARERSERLNQMLKSGDPAVLSQTDSIGSAVISRLKIEAAMASRRKTELEQTLGPRHPRVAAAAAEVERSRAQVAEEVKALAATADLDYQVARATEENARKAVERAQARLSDASQATVGLQELENEASARRDLYKAFVSRMEETTLQRNTQVSDARIVSPAPIPLKPFSPRMSLALALALVTGLGCGIALALYRGRPRLSTIVPPVPMASVDELPSVEADDVAASTPAAVPRPAEVTAVAPFDPAPPPVAAPAPVEAASAIAALADPAPRRDDPRDENRAAPIAEDEADAAASTIDAEPTAEAAPPLAGTSVPASESEPETEPERTEVRRATFALPLEALARLGIGGEVGGGVAALVETASGTSDAAALARFADLAATLGDPAETGGIRVIFSNTVPTLLTAGVAHGLARVAGTAALIDLAHESSSLDPLFEAGEPIAVAAGAEAETWERVDAAGLRLERPLDPVVAGDPAPVVGLADVFARLRAEGRAGIVHLGRMPTAALLFDCAAEADHVAVVVEETDLTGRRVADEIEVMKGLMPHFDGVVVLTHAGEDARRPLPVAPLRSAV